MFNIYAIKGNRLLATEKNIKEEDLELAISFLVSLTDCDGITVMRTNGIHCYHRTITKL